MKKLLILMGALIICDAYGASVAWILGENSNAYSTTSCSNGGNITKPTDPTKSGYRFIGWREATKKEILTTRGTSSTPANNAGGSVWTATFPYGVTITGQSVCSSTDYNTYYPNRQPSTTSSGANCWCKVTNLGGLGNIVDLSGVTIDWWYFRSNYGDSCAKGCAPNCGSYAKSSAEYQKGLKGLTY